MAQCCVICTEPLGKAKVMTECGHESCTSCFARNVALNVGGEEGTTRHLCMFCRQPVCPEVKPSMQFQMRLESAEIDRDDFWNELVTERVRSADLKEQLDESDRALDRAIFANDRRSNSVRRLNSLCIQYSNLLSYHYDRSETATTSILTIQTWWRGITTRKVITEWRTQLNTLMSLCCVTQTNQYSRSRSAVIIQNFRRTFVARRRVQLEKNRHAWTIYKNIVKDTFELDNSENIYSRDTADVTRTHFREIVFEWSNGPPDIVRYRISPL